MLFDGLPVELPTATLLPSASHARHRLIGGRLRHWLGDRWAWLRPRTVPMIAAFIGMLWVLGSTKYLSTFAAPSRAALYDPSAMGDRPASSIRCGPERMHATPSGHIHIAPVRPGSHDVTITLEP